MEVFSPDSDAKEKRNLSNLLQLRKRGYYFGEYLTQGELDIEGKCAWISMQQMIELGLFELQPDLAKQDKWCQWANTVLKLRTPFAISQGASSTTHAEVRKAVTIAGCLGDRWAVPMAAMLLALKPRRRNYPVILDGFKAMFARKMHFSSRYWISADNFSG